MLYFYFNPITNFQKLYRAILDFQIDVASQDFNVVPKRRGLFYPSHLSLETKKFNLNDFWEHQKLFQLNFSHVVLLVKQGLTMVGIQFTIFWNMTHYVIFLFHTHKRVFKSHTVQSWIFKLMLHLRTLMLHPTDVGCSANHNFVFILSYWIHNQSVDTLFGQSYHIWNI